MNIDADLPRYPATRTGCPFDPPAAYVDWNKAGGLRRVRLWNGREAWVATRYEDVRAVLADPRISSDGARPDMPTVSPASQVMTPLRASFNRMDDPDHTRLRSMVARDFSARRTAELRPRIQEMADDLIDTMMLHGSPADLVAEFALPFPSLVISLMLGIPYEEHDFFQKHSIALLDTHSSAEEVEQAGTEMRDFLRELTAVKERRPGDDIISRLVTEQLAVGSITRDELVDLALLLLISGHEATTNMIGLGVVALLGDPVQRARVRDTDDPAFLAGAVEELLRYLSAADAGFARVVTEDIEIGGHLLRAGDGVFVSLSAANRDGSVFDSADTLDTGRGAPRHHLAFGYGSHQCLGQSLVRADLQTALPTLLRRLPELRLAVPVEQISFAHMGTFGPVELPVAW
ncbi:cytochrome P450 [Streptomyces fagopyri]|uniref:Cytochrome P450 n=1 Tax=Streptomyces fagopyri TaxID=2662397 RepID=A0A5Q0L5S2_9ACTN|nr:cytochrome P450 [Streptomyces fagopyri]QFZ72352.1 cytochrome P450 [Streptomyces fagopyri]